MTPKIRNGMVVSCAFLFLVLGFLAGKMRHETVSALPAATQAAAVVPGEPPLADPDRPEPACIMPVRFDLFQDEAALPSDERPLPDLLLPSLHDLPWLQPSSARTAENEPGVNLSMPEPVAPEVTIVRRPAGVEGSVELLAMPRPVEPRPVSRRALPLTGSFCCRIEDGHVLELPAGVCEQVEAVVYLRTEPAGWLWLGTAASLEQLAHRTEPTRRRLVYAGVVRCDLDAHGRLYLPEGFLQAAGLCADVVIIGAGDHLEIWDACRWHSYVDDPDQSKQIERVRGGLQ